MAGTHELPLDLLFEVSEQLPPEDRLNMMVIHEDVYPHLLHQMLFSRAHEDVLAPLGHALKTDNLTMLSMIDNIIRTETDSTRDWNWFLTNPRLIDENQYIREAELFPLKEAMRYSSRCFKFLLDIILSGYTAVLRPKEGPFPTDGKVIISAEELLAAAIFRDHVECVGILLDRPRLFELCGRPFTWDDTWEGFMGGSKNVLAQIPSARMAEYLISRGWKPHLTALHETCSVFEVYRENRTDLLDILVSSGADVNGVDEAGKTPLWIACDKLHVLAIEALLKLGANPNAISRVDGQMLPAMRPIDVLLAPQQWRRNWRRVGRAMYKSIKALIEHGAIVSLLPGAPESRDPARVVLGGVWRLICPILRNHAGVGKGLKVTWKRLLEVLLTVDVRPLDKLCDLVLDASPTYSKISKGLTGKERLAKVLPHVKGVRLMYQWQTRDRPCFEDYCPGEILWDDDNDDFEFLVNYHLYDSKLDYYELYSYMDDECDQFHLSIHRRVDFNPRMFHIHLDPIVIEVLGVEQDCNYPKPR